MLIFQEIVLQEPLKSDLLNSQGTAEGKFYGENAKELGGLVKAMITLGERLLRLSKLALSIFNYY